MHEMRTKCACVCMCVCLGVCAQGCAHARGGHPGHPPQSAAGRSGADPQGLCRQQGLGGARLCGVVRTSRIMNEGWEVRGCVVWCTYPAVSVRAAVHEPLRHTGSRAKLSASGGAIPPARAGRCSSGLVALQKAALTHHYDCVLNTCSRVRTRALTHAHSYTHTCAHTHSHTNTQTRAHTHTGTHARAYTLKHFMAADIHLLRRPQARHPDWPAAPAQSGRCGAWGS